MHLRTTCRLLRARLANSPAILTPPRSLNPVLLSPSPSREIRMAQSSALATSLARKTTILYPRLMLFARTAAPHHKVSPLVTRRIQFKLSPAQPSTPLRLHRHCQCPASTQSRFPNLRETLSQGRMFDNSRHLPQPTARLRRRSIHPRPPQLANRLWMPSLEQTGQRRKGHDKQVLFTHLPGLNVLCRLPATVPSLQTLITPTQGIACPSDVLPAVSRWRN